MKLFPVALTVAAILGVGGNAASPQKRASLRARAGEDLALAGLQSPVPDSAQLFLQLPTYPVEDAPYSVAVGDLNGDGNPDFVVANSYCAYITCNRGGSVSVFLNDGKGGFGTGETYIAGNGAYSVAIADLNGDGIPDLVTADRGDNTVSVFLGEGHGRFGARASYPAGSAPVSVAAADLNGDGKPDLIVADYDANSISVLLNLGKGLFGAPQNYSVGQEPSSVAAGDLNGDGHPDLAVANSHGGTVSILRGNGDGTFGPQSTVSVLCCPQSVAIADLNGDGNLDLVTADLSDQSFNNTVSVVLGNGDGTFQAHQEYLSGVGATSIAVADFDGDGKPDLVTANSGGGSVSILLGRGDGTFRPKRDFIAGEFTDAVAVGDFNGDGNADAVVVSLRGLNSPSSNGAVSILFGEGDGNLVAAQQFNAGEDPQSVVTGDWNGDGKADLAVSDYCSGADICEGGFHPGHVSILLGNGDGTFQERRKIEADYGTSALITGDFNGDGKPDLAVLNDCGMDSTCETGPGTVTIFLGKGDGSFARSEDITLTAYTYDVKTADFNGDGVLDLVVSNLGQYDYGTTVTIYQGNGDGTFQTGISYQTGEGPYELAVGDLNRDGYPDIMTLNAFGGCSVLLNNGKGVFPTYQYVATPEDTEGILLADMNHDGVPDLLVTTYTLGDPTISIALGNGKGTFGTFATYPLTYSPYSLTTADFNADGNRDVAVQEGGAVEIFPGDGKGGLGQSSLYPAGGGGDTLVAGIAVADFNQDGRWDIASDYTHGKVLGILLNATGTRMELTSAPNPSNQGDEVKFTARVAPSVKGAGMPTGKVTFRAENGQQTVNLKNGVAEFETSKLGAGRHRVAAEYSGDSQFAARRSNVIVQAVNP